MAFFIHFSSTFLPYHSNNCHSTTATTTHYVYICNLSATLTYVTTMLQDFTLDFYFRQFWTDPRLAYRKRPGVEQLSVGSDFVKSIWVPDTFFVNEKQSYFHIATTSNEFIRVHHSGAITRSMR